MLGGSWIILAQQYGWDENELHRPRYRKAGNGRQAVAPAVSAAGAVLIRADTGAILFEKDAEKTTVSGKHYQNHDSAGGAEDFH